MLIGRSTSDFMPLCDTLHASDLPDADRSDRRRAPRRVGRMLDLAVDTLPTPMLVAVVIFLVHLVIITDCGAGAPIFFPICRLFLKPFQPSIEYVRIKTKYL